MKESYEVKRDPNTIEKVILNPSGSYKLNQS